MMNLYKKELGYYLNNPIGYIIIVLFAAVANFLYVKDIFLVGSASMKPFFAYLPWIFMIFIPALTMRIISEEKRTNTIELLLSLPVSETQIILAKFLALLTLVLIGLLLTLFLPISLYVLKGAEDFGATNLYAMLLPEIISGYIGSLFLAGLYIAISMFFSSQTKNQVVAFLISVLVIFFLTVISTDFVGTLLPGFIQDSLIYFTPQYHLQNFIKGVLDLRSFVYFAGGIIIFLLFTIIDLEKRV